MKFRVGNGLLPMNLLVIVLIPIIILVPSNAARIILGLPFMLFFPGYALITVLFPKKGDIGGVERAALSFGISIAVVAFLGLVNNYTWGITVSSSLASIAIFIFIASIVAWYRLRRLAEEERFSTSFDLSFAWQGQSTLDKALSAILTVAIVGAVGTLVYAAVTPEVGERFTELYILGREGKAANYPTELRVGEEDKVTLGIINQEQETVSYQIVVTIDGIKTSGLGPVTLEHEGKWEGEVSFTPTKTGNNQKVEFSLYEGDKPSPEESVHLWINVANNGKS